MPIDARSCNVRGQDTVTGNVANESTTKKVESGKRITTITRGKCALGGQSATRSATVRNRSHTEVPRVVYEDSFSFNESAKVEVVGEETIVGKRESSMDGAVGEGCAKRTNSSICTERENRLYEVIACLFSGCGISFVGETGEDDSVEPDNEEARFLDEQVLRVSGGLREVEDALARFWGGVREEGSDMG